MCGKEIVRLPRTLFRSAGRPDAADNAALNPGLVLQLRTNDRAQRRQIPCEIAGPPAVNRRSHQAQITVGADVVAITTKC